MTMTALFGADHYHDQVMELFTRGDGKGESTGFSSVDELYTVARGQMTVITGIPSSGKSNFLDQIMVNLARTNGWKFAVASMENEPSKHIAKLSEMYVGKPFFQQWPGAMTLEEARAAHAWCKEHFCFIDFTHSRDLPTLDALLDRAHAAALRYGIDGLVIDPYNCIDIGRTKDQNETESVSNMLSKVSAFAKAADIHVWFVAHPQKMVRDPSSRTPVPTGYDISGSAHWYNKTDVGITVHRRDTDGYVEIHCWKCRFNWVGRQGMARLKYDIPTSTYYQLPHTQDGQS
jgi:twinkle protein